MEELSKTASASFLAAPESKNEKEPHTFSPAFYIKRSPLLQQVTQTLLLEDFQGDAALTQAEIMGHSPKELLCPFNQGYIEAPFGGQRDVLRKIALGNRTQNRLAVPTPEQGRAINGCRPFH